MRKFYLLLVLLLLCASGLRAQTQESTTEYLSAASIQLGTPAVALNGPWKFHTGDSPKIGGVAAWAQPDFDDSGWQNYTIDPKNPNMTAVEAVQSKELPG